MFGIFDAENEMDLSAAYTEVHIATFLSFGMNVMQVKFTKVNKVTAGQEMRDLWGGLSIPWSRCKCHMEKYFKHLCSPQDQAMLNLFSAVCFLYGRSLYDHLKVYYYNVE